MTPEEATTLLKAGWIPTRLDSSARPSFSFEDVKQIIELIESLQSENAELKAKLENAIVPKFRTGKYVYAIINKKVQCVFIHFVECFDDIGDGIFNIRYQCSPADEPDCYEDSDGYFKDYLSESELFATEVEALESLKNSKE